MKGNHFRKVKHVCFGGGWVVPMFKAELDFEFKAELDFEQSHAEDS